MKLCLDWNFRYVVVGKPGRLPGKIPRTAKRMVNSSRPNVSSREYTAQTDRSSCALHIRVPLASARLCMTEWPVTVGQPSNRSSTSLTRGARVPTAPDMTTIPLHTAGTNGLRPSNAVEFICRRNANPAMWSATFATVPHLNARPQIVRGTARTSTTAPATTLRARKRRWWL